jgi:hypothetical protein
MNSIAGLLTRSRMRLAVVATTLVVVTTAGAAAAAMMPGSLGFTGTPTAALQATVPSPDPCDPSLDLPYVAAGDGIPAGAKKTDGTNGTDKANEYPAKLVAKLVNDGFPFCLHNIAHGPTTTDSYRTDTVDDGPQQANLQDLRPRLVTLHIGRENEIIKRYVSDCMTLIKNHQFTLANACAAAILAAQPAWKKLNDDLSDILNQTKVLMDGNPQMVVAVLGYYNPYPSATDVATKIPQICSALIDTIPTCLINWVQLPPALVLMDQITKKLNSTIQGVVEKFQVASQGRYFFVNPYDKFKDHCTEMQVEIKTTVYHPTNEVDHHDLSKTNIGCSNTWIKSDGDDGTLPPWHYLPPAIDGVLIDTTQTTSEMGAYPNDDGHNCLADLVYQAKDGWGTLRNMLGIPGAWSEPCP